MINDHISIFKLQARLVACNCRIQLGHDNARALYLCAIVASREGNSLKDAQKLLEKVGYSIFILQC